VPISINRGSPIVLDKPAHPVSRAIRELAAKLAANNTQQRAGGRLRRAGR
jgi:pilus assembly protein CpaE